MFSQELDLAWAAGFFDGEGSFTWRIDGHGRLECRCSLPQVERQPLDRFLAAVGVGRIVGPHQPPSRLKSRPIYTWQASGMPSVLEVMGALAPYLCEPKLTQGLKVLDAWYEWRAGVRERHGERYTKEALESRVEAIYYALRRAK